MAYPNGTKGILRLRAAGLLRKFNDQPCVISGFVAAEHRYLVTVTVDGCSRELLASVYEIEVDPATIPESSER